MLAAVLAWVFVAPVFAGVRGTQWGISKAEVERIEEKRPKEQADDRLVYEDVLAGLETEVTYLFNHRGELYSIEYDFHMELPFMTHAIRQFDRISRILRGNYGPPTGGGAYPDKEKRIGALALERPIVEKWTKDGVTSIVHTLKTLKGSGGYKHTLAYAHKGLKDEYQRFCKEKQMEKF
ncbi:MAG: hypothetical protein JRH07_12635 [Deltaproteobacteria bacterium]|nr:hypothetical protein [Deltaproteobacteria bacterium]MBW2122671.1 hypothetical protein [Deltaproteobacteria bacterium]